MRSYWFGDLDNGICTPYLGDGPSRAGRVATLRTSLDDFIPLSWEDAVSCGVCSSRTEYIAALREVCFYAAEQEIRERYAGKDAELLQMVRTLDEMDNVINLLSERVAEWHQVRHPTFSRKYRKTPAHVLIKTIATKGRGALGRTASQIEQLAAARTDLAREVSDRANRVMPNTSALIGGLVAARLMAAAGGLLPLSRLPASVIQVLGARTALFAHLRTQSPSPKHGIIFQHRRVHNAPREVRGKVARVLAGKLAIAAKLDYFRGVAVPEFLEAAQARIDATGACTGRTEEP
ncbi:RNA-processing protein [uncultured Methanoregula sp.]|uniref:RNA-processing protein n=1 Tax=uncultured Methanoregula sp. TaxID=1005933 RepID=UPI002AAA716E|nr:RNA-processing protein [uncultured Methanoregula sp.]